MLARDVMTKPVLTIGADASVRELADLLVKYQISAVPVTDRGGKVVGMVSEGDLMRRTELGTRKARSWWLQIFSDRDSEAADFVKANAHKVRDVMSKSVISVASDTPLNELAKTLEESNIKRVPVINDGQLVGIVSRANLIRAFATHEHRIGLEIERSDESIRKRVDEALLAEPWMKGLIVNCLVEGGVVDLWGLVPDETVKTAVRVAAEAVPGVKAVNDHLVIRWYGSGT